MDATQLLSNRRSVGKLTAPGPDDAVLDRVLRAALRAPDHGALRPWRVLVVRDAGLLALGEVVAEGLRARDPSAGPEALDDARRKVSARAPLVLVIAACVRPSAKIPEVEQVLSAGALAQTVLLGLEAEGFGAIWRTGPAAYDPHVKARLGLAERDHIVGFLYVGSVAHEPPAQPRPPLEAHVARWPPA